MALGNFIKEFPNVFYNTFFSLPLLPVPTVAAMGSPVFFDAKKIIEDVTKRNHQNHFTSGWPGDHN